MRATACMGLWQNFGVPTDQWAKKQIPPTNLHHRLARHIYRLISCPSYYVINFWMLFVWKKMTCHYFAIATVGEWRKRPDEVRPTWWPKPGANECFYLSKYPVFWSEYDHTWHWPHLLAPRQNYPFALEPFIPGVDMGLFKDLTPDRWENYISPEHISDYTRQRDFIKTWADAADRCINANYPSEKPIKTRTVTTPQGTLPWPGKPANELTPPTPEAPATTPEQAASMPYPPLRLQLTFSYRELIPNDAMTATIIIA